MSEHNHPALMPTYPRCEVHAVRGEGAYLFDQNDRRFLDFASGIAVNSLGHCHPHLVAALKAQSEKIWHCANLYRIPEGERLAQRLVDASFADRVFFTNSGVEALECSVKAARRWQHDNGHPEKTRVIGFHGAFHGRSTMTIAAAGNAAYLKGFGPVTPGFDHVAFGNMNEVRQAVTPETAAILVEPVQGEGGLRAGDPEFLKALRAVCDEYGLLLILDEVQCGAGRTGKLYAHVWSGIDPDILATAKGIGGGFPLGACLATEEVGKVMVPGTHGSTYGGNPMAMAIGNAVLDVLLADGFLDEVTRKGQILGDKLRDLVARYPEVWSELRGAGLMLGLKAVQPNREVMEKLRHAGLLTVAAGDNVLRLLPPLILEEAQIDEALAILESVSGDVAKAA